jgi:FixJ family two-component response regulator
MWFDRAMMQQALAEINASNQTAESDDDAANIAALTPRECEIIALVCEGLKNKQIAERTFISEKPFATTSHLSSASSFSPTASNSSSTRIATASLSFANVLRRAKSLAAKTIDRTKLILFGGIQAKEIRILHTKG